VKSSKIELCNSEFNPDGYWRNPIPVWRVHTSEELASLCHLFDQNGYDLTLIEQLYAKYNTQFLVHHRGSKYSLQQPWFVQEYRDEGAQLNHALLLERKAYSGDALNQLKEIAKHTPIFNKIIAIRPKWGIDFSMDYFDRDGNVFEILHYEFDSFDYREAYDKMQFVYKKIKDIDWNDAAKTLLKRKDEWHNLEFFEQSDYKTNFFGVGQERFKQVIWD